MTTYRLPAELGGIEVREAGKRGDGRLILVPVAPELAEFDWEFCLDQGALTETKPPLPDEPDVLAVELGGRVWTREGWPGEHHWESKGFHGASWLALNQLASGVPIVPLVPDPADYARVLPFELLDDEGDPYLRMSAHHYGIQLEMFQGLHEVDLSGDEPYALAAAILRVVREARRAEGGVA